VTNVPHVFSVDLDEVVSGQDAAVPGEGAARRHGANDEPVGAVVLDVDLGPMLRFYIFAPEKLAKTRRFCSKHYYFVTKLVVKKKANSEETRAMGREIKSRLCIGW
jgi:hypothetical protein